MHVNSERHHPKYLVWILLSLPIASGCSRNTQTSTHPPDVATLQPAHTVSLALKLDDALTQVVVSPLGQSLAIVEVEPRRVEMIDTQTWQPGHRVDLGALGAVRTVDYSGDGLLLGTTAYVEVANVSTSGTLEATRTLLFYDMQSDSLHRCQLRFGAENLTEQAYTTMVEHRFNCGVLAFTGRERHFYTAGYGREVTGARSKRDDSTIWLWNMAGDSGRDVYHTEGRIVKLVAVPKHELLLVGEQPAANGTLPYSRLVCVDPSTRLPRWSLSYEDTLRHDVAISDVANHVVTLDENEIVVVRLQSGEIEKRIPVGDRAPFEQVELSSDGTRFVLGKTFKPAANSPPGIRSEIEIWDVKSARCVCSALSTVYRPAYMLLDDHLVTISDSGVEAWPLEQLLSRRYWHLDSKLK